MAEPRRTRGPLQVHVDYLFDRLHDSKLAQAYGILVPVRERPVGGSVKVSTNAPLCSIEIGCMMFRRVC